MTFHFPDDVDVNVLTIDATDPKSGTAEFKAAAIRVEKLPASNAADSLQRACRPPSRAGNGDRAAGNGDRRGPATATARAQPRDVRA